MRYKQWTAVAGTVGRHAHANVMGSYRAVHPPPAQVETLLGTKADVSDMERRALKTEVDASLRTQMSDLYTLLRSKAEDSEFKVGGRWGERDVGLRAGGWWRVSCSAGRDGGRVGLSAPSDKRGGVFV